MDSPLKAILIHADDGPNRNTYFNSAPLGIHRIRKWLENIYGDKLKIDCFDPNLYDNSRETLNEKLSRERYNLVGYSPLHDTLSRDIGHMLDAGKILPNALHIAGGQQAGLSKDLLFPYIPELKIIARGDGEKPMTELVQKIITYGIDNLKNNPAKYLSDVKGLYIRTGQGTTIPIFRQLNEEDSDTSIFTGHGAPFSPEEFVKATRAVDFTDVNLDLYWKQLLAHYSEEQLQDPALLSKILTVKPYTSNYCPMGCGFCSTTFYHKDSFGRPAKVVAMRGDDLSDYVTDLLFKNPNTRKVLFKDDLWFLRGGNSEDLLADLNVLKKIKENVKQADGRDISYHGKARVDTWVNPRNLNVNHDLLKATKEAGFVGISIGVESYDADELEAYNKKLGPNGPEVNRLALKSCKEYGLNVVSYMILSGLYSTSQSLVNSLRGITDSLIEGNIVRINDKLFSLPGTKIDEDLKNTNEGLSMSVEDAVVGYPDIKIKRIVSILPRDLIAREVVSRYEERLLPTRKEWQERLEVTHWIPEVEGPHKMHVLNEILGKMNLISQEEASHRNETLENILMTYKKSGREISKEQTAA
jgi:radical SAM superfamily enzyme YgiQ (UPF0313 family)